LPDFHRSSGASPAADRPDPTYAEAAVSVHSRRPIGFVVLVAVVALVALPGIPGIGVGQPVGGEPVGVTRSLADAGPVSAVQPRVQAGVVADLPDPSKVSLGLSLLKSGFDHPVLVTNAGDGSGRLFVVEQAGSIRIISGGTVLPTPFLDLRGRITSGGEGGPPTDEMAPGFVPADMHAPRTRGCALGGYAGSPPAAPAR